MTIFQSSDKIITQIDRFKIILNDAYLYHSCIKIGNSCDIFAAEVDLSLIRVIEIVFSLVDEICG